MTNDGIIDIGGRYTSRTIDRLTAERVAARADAERLAEALRGLIHDLVNPWTPGQAVEEARAALAAHDETTP